MRIENDWLIFVRWERKPIGGYMFVFYLKKWEISISLQSQLNKIRELRKVKFFFLAWDKSWQSHLGSNLEQRIGFILPTGSLRSQ